MTQSSKISLILSIYKDLQDLIYHFTDLQIDIFQFQYIWFNVSFIKTKTIDNHTLTS